MYKHTQCKKVVVPVNFLPSAQVVAKKQDSSFQNWEVSQEIRKTTEEQTVPGK